MGYPLIPDPISLQTREGTSLFFPAFPLSRGASRAAAKNHFDLVLPLSPGLSALIKLGFHSHLVPTRRRCSHANRLVGYEMNKMCETKRMR